MDSCKVDLNVDVDLQLVCNIPCRYVLFRMHVRDGVWKWAPHQHFKNDACAPLILNPQDGQVDDRILLPLDKCIFRGKGGVAEYVTEHWRCLASNGLVYHEGGCPEK